jgi:hypothetical protein
MPLANSAARPEVSRAAAISSCPLPPSLEEPRSRHDEPDADPEPHGQLGAKLGTLSVSILLSHRSNNARGLSRVRARQWKRAGTASFRTAPTLLHFRL